MLFDFILFVLGYKGLICIGIWVQGKKDGKVCSVFIYNYVDYEVVYYDVEYQVIVYIMGVFVIIVVLQFFCGEWVELGVFNMEQFNFDFFLEMMLLIGLGWDVMELEFGQLDI